MIARLACLDFMEAGPWARGTVRNAGSISRKRKPCGRSRGVDVVTKLFYVLLSLVPNSQTVTRDCLQVQWWEDRVNLHVKNRQTGPDGLKKYIPMLILSADPKFYILLSRFL